MFGWVKPDGKRRFRRVYIEVPRGNAKSTLSSAVGLYMLTADGEGGAEIEELLELGHLRRDRLGLHVREAAELQVHVELAFGVALGQLVLHREGDRELLLAHHLLEVVLVDVDRLPVLERSRVGALREVAHHEHLQRKLDLFLRVARRRLVRDVDAFLRRDRSFFRHRPGLLSLDNSTRLAPHGSAVTSPVTAGRRTGSVAPGCRSSASPRGEPPRRSAA